MATGGTQSSSLTWLVYSLMTVGCWGFYGILLHGGIMAFDPRNDPAARYKAFLFVGLAYFLTAVLTPLVLIASSGTGWQFLSNVRGVSWSLVAGIAGALGAFFVLLAFGARGTPAVVMSIIFAGAPIVNAFVALLLHPPKGGFASVRWQFMAGILLAALGGFLVTRYKPGDAPAPKAALQSQAEPHEPLQ